MEVAGSGRTDEEATGASIDEDDSDDEDECCLCLRCPSQLFTSVLLGILACVLVTGGVFLAFHKWDHTWLLVSAIGVVLMAIGTALHCCSPQSDRRGSRKSHRCQGGCGGGRSKMDAISNGGGMLTEQLLPLSNARSVSQLSLNMVPGYFPPLVYPTGAPYGIEQHSTVVQNISRLVQHQQQLHLQAANSNDGTKSFILLPLPTDANAANIQNIVAAVCQLDSNNLNSSQENGRETATTDVSSQATEASFLSATNGVNDSTSVTQTSNQPISVTHPVMKHVEVQTCNVWIPNTPEQKSTTTTQQESASNPSQSASTTNDFSGQAMELSIENQPNVAVSSAVFQQPTIRDIVCTNATCDIEDNTVQCDIPVPDSLPEESLDCSVVTSSSPPIASQQQTEMQQNVFQGSDDETQQTVSVVSEEQFVSENNLNRPDVVIIHQDEIQTGETQTDLSESNNESTISTPEVSAIDHVDLELVINDYLSDSDDRASEDSDVLEERSSPPPSYDDVTQEVPLNPIGSFGLAYGTM